MPVEIDPSFRAARDRAKARQRARLRRGAGRWLMLGAVAATGALVVALAVSVAGSLRGPAPPVAKAAGDAILEGLAPVAAPLADFAFSTAFLDLPGDPLRIEQAGVGAVRARLVPVPEGLDPARAGGALVLLSGELMPKGLRLTGVLPTSQADFALFQAAAPEVGGGVPLAARIAAGPADRRQAEIGGAGEGSWGTADGTLTVDWAATRFEDITTTAAIRPATARTAPAEDVVLRLTLARALADILAEHGVDPPLADRFATEAEAAAPGIAAPQAGEVVALRLAHGPDGRKLPVAASRRADGAAPVSAARRGGVVAAAADPWAGLRLDQSEDEAGAVRADVRRLDAFFAAALQGGAPADLVGEAIVLMAQGLDLEAFANPGDRMVFVYASAPGSAGDGAGRILYAAIAPAAGGERLECFVARAAPSAPFRCHGRRGDGGGAPSGLRAGMVVPVPGGVLTSRFGMRHHPVWNRMLLHAGVDWAARPGTPVVAALAGEVAAAGDGGGYGNLVTLRHPGGLETRYAHLQDFAPGLAAGRRVAAGEVIGFVGTTGVSTGPHLHFELREAGEPVDPLGVTASGAAEALVARIVRIESGGQADARNTRSTATGLGQFIDATWIAMMQRYRPDLHGSLTREALLALRTDPDLSREMILAYTRENETFLRRAGHAITPGRLYLAHFLGPRGADAALRADPAALVSDVFEPAVITANPQLRGQTIAQLIDKVEGLMAGTGAAAAPAAAPLPPAVASLVRAVDPVVAGG